MNIANAGSNSKTVYMRYRPSTSTTWEATSNIATTGASAAFSLTGLSAETGYDVEAALASDFSGSRTATFTTSSTQPPPPPTPSVSSVTVGSITRTAATATVNIANAGSNSKTVYMRYRVSGGQWGSTRNIATTGASAAFSLTGLSAGTGYDVEASLASDFSGSRTATFTTSSTQPPPPPSPSVSSVTVGSITRTTATATVSIANAGSNSKTVYMRYRVSGGSYGAVHSANTSGSSASFNLTGLSAGTAYEVMAALNNAFTGSRSATFATSSTQPPPPPSPSVSSVTVSSITRTTATATANIANAGSNSKTVYMRYRVSGGSYGAVHSANTSGSSASFSLTGLSAGTTYQVMAALNNAFTGSRSATFTTNAPQTSGPPPSSPPASPPLNPNPDPNLYDLRVTDITRISAFANAYVTNLSSEGDMVYVRHRELGAPKWSAVESKIADGPMVSFYMNSLQPGTTCVVQASLTDDFESYETAEFTTLSPDPSVSSVSIGGITQTSATATVAIADAGAAQKMVYLRYRESGGQWGASQAMTTTGASAAFDLSGLSAGTGYDVEASLASDFSGSRTATFTTSSPQPQPQPSPTPSPSVSSVSISDITQTSATATVGIANAGTAKKTVHLRYRASGAAQWSATQRKTTIGASAAVSLSGLTASTSYDVEASLASDFTASKTATFTTLSPDPSVSTVSITDITQTTAKATVGIANAGTAEKTVYLRYRASGTAKWSLAPKKTTSGASESFGIVGLTPGTAYEVQASLASDFSAYIETMFTTVAPAPSVASVSVSGVTKTSATAQVSIANPDSSVLTVHLRYRTTTPQGEWSNALTASSRTTGASVEITGLTVDTQYEIEASLNSDFSDSVSVTFSTLPLDPVVSSVSISGIGRTSATASVQIANANGSSQTVHLRYRVASPQGSWSGMRKPSARMKTAQASA